MALHVLFVPFVFEVAFGCQGVRPMSVDILRDSANTRRQQRGSFKGGGYSTVWVTTTAS
ncbi:hypothetical protein [Candidatus Regiella insecticola]|uniref:Uncharacterized protein n=1 Tax=Candidatus Regiella insecticola TaxID=138073 RepID=A0A6L2ZLV8_9ENTR|nr:hypothetical protein [Candidatus Regiella insecticola]GFN45208.1 hypothetical protein RINTU1_02320 [Candidatus Regiella insecticola]